VAREIAAAAGIELAGGVEAPGHESVGATLREAVGADSEAVVVGSLADLTPGGLDVLVDFSTPEQAVRCAEFAAAAGVGLVVATTGLSEEQRASLVAASSKSAVVAASNTSVGANVLFDLLARAAAALGKDFDIEVVEAHHRNKRDAPSGTALTAVDAMLQARGERDDANVVQGRSGWSDGREPGEIGVHSIRGGAVAGRHTVHFLSELETISVEHVALSRQAFAVGAVRAARFAAESTPGLYDMRDVLGLKESSGT
jgi:4-hydroxy-tetrahydrodipicolinate reductase